MRYTVGLRTGVQNDIDHAYAYYEKQHQGLGDRFLANLSVVFATLEIHPQAYGYKFGLRGAPVRKFPYLVLFRVEAEQVLVFAVFHTRQNSETAIPAL